VRAHETTSCLYLVRRLPSYLRPIECSLASRAEPAEPPPTLKWDCLTKVGSKKTEASGRKDEVSETSEKKARDGT
jgi:hypothetical protein